MLVVACDEENDNPSPVNPSDTTQTDYPPTADVIANAVTDIDGNSYDAVRIGNQVWMASNLRTTRFANGDAIPEGLTVSLTEPLRYTPSTTEEEYGCLYNWAAVMHGETSSITNPSGVQGVCPTGWHVPSEAEWNQLTAYLAGRSEYVCSGNGNNIAKALAADHGWHIINENECAVGNDLGGNNATGFSALPAGYYCGDYYGFGGFAYFWSATEYVDNDACYRSLYFNGADVNRNNDGKNYGFSVRCVRD